MLRPQAAYAKGLTALTARAQGPCVSITRKRSCVHATARAYGPKVQGLCRHMYLHSGIRPVGPEKEAININYTAQGPVRTACARP